jgi:hypothetical protein
VARPVLRLLLAAGATFLLLPLVLLVGVLAIPFWVVAGLTRVLARLLEPAHIPWNRVVEFDRAIGWRPRANLDTAYVTAEEPEVFSVVTDAEGWPGRGTIANSDVVVFGDSYAFGYGVNAGAAFWERADGLRIKAIGAPAYNIVQQVLLMRQLAPRLTGKSVVSFVFLGNDLLENLLPSHHHYRMPFVRENPVEPGWQIVTSHLGFRYWRYVPEAFRDSQVWMRMRADLYRSSPLARRAYGAHQHLIRQAADVCRDAGAFLTVMTIPDPAEVRPGELREIFRHSADPGSCDANFPETTNERMCAEEGVSFLAGRRLFESRHYKAIDPHWSEEGHRRIAEILQCLHRERPAHVRPIDISV